MSFWKKPKDDESNQVLAVNIYGAGGGGNHSPAQLGGSVAAAPALGGGTLSTTIYGNNITAGTFAPPNISDHIIQGQMLVAEHLINTHEAQFIDDDHIKRLLIAELVEKMYQGKYIEFTKQTDPYTLGIKARARIYVTPDSNVKILRTWQK